MNSVQAHSESEARKEQTRFALFGVARWIAERRFAVASLRAVFAASAIAVGALVINSTALEDTFYVLSYITLFLVSEFILVQTSRDTRIHIEGEIRSAYEARFSTQQERLNAIAAQLEMYFCAQQKISFRIGKTAETIAAVVRSARSGAIEGNPVLKKESIVDEVLGDLCDAFESTTSKSRDILRSESWFRATYMEVRESAGVERLAFIAFHTPDGNMPNSMSQNLTLVKGDGDAGKAWENRRPVIEDLFKDGHGWKELYPGQGVKYKSMVCVPVFRGTRDMVNDVIGVITIDTRIPGYFGSKGDQEDEDRFASIVRPYASYICLITSLTDALTLPILRAAPTVQSRVAD